MSDSFTSSSGGSTSASPSAPPATTSESWTSLGLVSTSQSGLEKLPLIYGRTTCLKLNDFVLPFSDDHILHV